MTNPPPVPNPMHNGTNPYPRPDTGPNLPLLHATRDFIAALPAGGADDGMAWDQAEWRCETGMCFAGWAAALAGATFPYPADDHSIVEITAGRLATAIASAVVKDADGKLWHASEYAAHVLALPAYTAATLFAGGNDLTEIAATVDDITDGRKPYIHRFNYDS